MARPQSRVVMLAVDGSEGSRYALQYYLNTISTEKDHLILVHVRQTFQDGFLSEMESKEEIQNYENMLESRSRELLGSFHSFVEKSQSPVIHHCEKRSMRGDPREKLAEAIEEYHPDLLIMGSHGRGLIGRTILGSVSDYMAHNSLCPILIVRPPKASPGLPGTSGLAKVVEMAH